MSLPINLTYSLDWTETNGSVSDFIREYAMNADAGQNTFLDIDMGVLEECKQDYPEHLQAIEQIQQSMANVGAYELIIKFWW